MIQGSRIHKKEFNILKNDKMEDVKLVSPRFDIVSIYNNSNSRNTSSVLVEVMEGGSTNNGYYEIHLPNYYERSEDYLKCFTNILSSSESSKDFLNTIKSLRGSIDG